MILVLNAFRHHRNSHKIASSVPAVPLISAQRLSASSEFSRDLVVKGAFADWCSTPFGIIGILTIEQVSFALLDSTVLNAFRHHRNSHRALSAGQLSESECSTPFGIIGILTPRFALQVVAFSLCSTPFGIIGILTQS